MASMSIQEAAQYFGISKEAIHNRIRRGSLNVSVIDGIKFVEVDKDAQKSSPTKTQTRKTTTKQVVDERYYKLLEEQNAKLQAKVEKLEDETQNLRNQKEHMLIQERLKIEQIYKDKDEQLKNILTSISSQFMLNTLEVEPLEQSVEVLEAEIEVQEEIETDSKDTKIISLKKYFKINNISIEKREKILSKFKKRAKKDERIITIGKKYYINLDKYKYKGLLPK